MRSRILSLVTVAIIVAAAAGCKKSSPSEPTPPAPGGTNNTTIVIPRGDGYAATSFSPGSVNIAVGTTVIWSNQDTQTHRITSDTNLFDGGASPSDSYTRQFSTRGSFAYHCSLHPTMTGTINVQ